MNLSPLVLDLGLVGAAVILHEVGHGVVAYGCGDRTAAERGRLTLNPLRHVDPVGTVLVPVLLGLSAWAAGARPLLFGWAKPVPIDPRRMRNPRRDMALVALAGPLVNLCLAVASAVVLVRRGAHHDPRADATALAAGSFLAVNCVLGVLNLLPIPPLDGGRVLAAIAPRAWRPLFFRVERVGLLVIFVLLATTNVLPALVMPVLHGVVRLGAAIGGAG
jgi:Zn-dependent protease